MEKIFLCVVLLCLGLEVVLGCRGLGIAFKPAISAASKVKVPLSSISSLTRVKTISSFNTRILNNLNDVKPFLRKYNSFSKFKPKASQNIKVSSISKQLVPSIKYSSYTPRFRYSYGMKVTDYSDISKLQLMFEEVGIRQPLLRSSVSETTFLLDITSTDFQFYSH